MFNPISKPPITYKALQEWVRQGEGLFLEFKLKTNHPEKIVREMIAFANTQGGKLLVGIGDDKTIKGLKYADEDEFLLIRAIEKHCEPIFEYEIQKIKIETGFEVLVFTIEKSMQKPHYFYVDKNIENRKVYVRVADKSIQASKEIREILKGECSQRNIRFQYGEKEQLLMKYLDDKQQITVNQFAEFAQLPRKIASKTLILLTLANVLRVFPAEIADTFVRKNVTLADT